MSLGSARGCMHISIDRKALAGWGPLAGNNGLAIGRYVPALFRSVFVGLTSFPSILARNLIDRLYAAVAKLVKFPFLCLRKFILRKV